MRATAFVIALGVLISGSTRAQDPFRPTEKSKEYLEAYERGREEAEQELTKESATIYSFGRVDYSDNLDEESGLFYSNLGCRVDDKIKGLFYGYNDRIAEYIKAHGVPRNSFKPWEKELLGLNDYFETRRENEKPGVLRAGGPILKSHDEKHAMRAYVEEHTTNGKIVRSLRVRLMRKHLERDLNALVAGVDDELELFWGPKGSNFAIIAESGFYQAFDLRTGRLLRSEVPTRNGKLFPELYDPDRPNKE